MTAWEWSQQGPATEDEVNHARTPRSQAAGEIVCPDCDNVIARVFDDRAVARAEAWVPGPAPAPRRDGKPSLLGGPTSFGFLFIGDVPDGDGSIAFMCWNGHPSVVTADLCREVVAARRARGSRAGKVRRLAERTAPC